MTHSVYLKTMSHEWDLIKSKAKLMPIVKQKLLSGTTTKEDIVWLVNRHPSKDKLRLIQDPWTFHIVKDHFGAPKLLLLGPDNKWEATSWKVCVNKRLNKGCAYRDEVRDQVTARREEFRQSLCPCHVCNQPIEYNDMTVDHIPDFNELKKMFIKEHGESEVNGTTERYLFIDREYAARWQDFHRINASLRPSHRKCNSKRYHD